MPISPILEALRSNVISQAYIDLTGQLLREEQNSAPNGNVFNETKNWLANSMSSISEILVADRYKLLGLDSVPAIRYAANSIIYNTGNNYVSASVLEPWNVFQDNVGANSRVSSSFEILVHEKNFATANTLYGSSSTDSQNALSLSNWIDTRLNSNNVFTRLNITTGVEFALANNYLTSTPYNSNTFNSSALTDSIEGAVEFSFASNKRGVVVFGDGKP